MRHKIAVFALDSDRVNRIILDRLFLYYLPKRYEIIVFSKNRIRKLPKGVIQNNIDYSRITKSWIQNNLSAKQCRLLFISHASLANVVLKSKIIYFRRKKIRFINFSGDYYSLKDFKNIIVQNLYILQSTDEYDDETGTVFLVGRRRKLTAKALRLILLVPSLILILPSLVEMLVFMVRSKNKNQ